MSSRLIRELNAAKELRQSILAAFGEDTELIRDTIEGETNLHDQIGHVADSIREDEILIGGIEKISDDLAAKKKRLADRIATKRALILQAMAIGELKTLELADVTLTVKALPRGVEIVDEAQIPSEFWTPRDPTLDRRRIAEALKSGAAVPGATLDNGGVTLAFEARMMTPLRTRFESKWVGEPNSGCWLWIGTVGKIGYGVIRAKINGKWTLQYAHRLSYEWHVGPIPNDLGSNHKCRKPTCINPAHLEAVTHQENVRRGGIATRLRRPTCARGHLLDEANIYVRKSGERICKTCSKARAREHYYAKKPGVASCPR